MDHVNGIKAAIAAAAGALTGLWGWMGWLVIGWVACMVMDYITGTAAARKVGAWTSARAREGIWHKAGMIVVVMVSAGTDLLLAVVLENIPMVNLPFQYGGLICPVVLVWYILTELGSITENAVAMGAGVPPWLVKLLAAGKEVVDKAGDGFIKNNSTDE
ncbi:MAG: phage holin family protein [Lawsonibacter sp.]|nr:phage holin family protein [Lawsonibacter sp.]